MLYLNSENYTKIHILNRAQIIDDAFYFLLKKELGYNMFWNLTNFLLYDTNYVTWYSMIKVFESMTCIFSFQHNTDIMVSIIRDFYEKESYIPYYIFKKKANSV